MFDFVPILFFLTVMFFVNVAIIFLIGMVVGFVLDKFPPNIQKYIIPHWEVREAMTFLFFIGLAAAEIYFIGKV